MYFRLKGKGRLIRKGVESLVHEGPRITWMRVRRKTRKAFENANMLKRPLFTHEELAAQRADQFPQAITFSVVVPLYNTNRHYLRQMIRSVLSQTYSGWQLCLADGSDEEHDDVEEICQMYAARDSRICYRRLDRNYGISGRHEKRTSPGYMRRLQYVQNMTAVTAACMMVRRDVWDELSGLDESFAVSFNDIDFCMRVRRAGYLIVWTPYVFNRTARAMLVRLDPDVHGIELHDWMAYQVVACTGRVVYDAHSHMSYRQHGDNAIGAVRDPQRERLRKVRSFWSGPMRNSRERSARRIEAVYGELLTPQNRELVSDFAHYRQSVLRRFRLLTKRARIIGEIKRHLFRLLVICGRL